jgi:uncharacterized Tic20 family protein
VHEEQHYGRSREPGDGMGDPGGDPFDGAEGPTGSTMSPQDERTWSIVAHLSVLVWPITGFLPVAPLIIWLVYKDRSRRVGFHSLQSLWYQVAWLVLGMVVGFLATIFVVLTLGFGIILVLPLALLLGLIPFVHGCYAAYKVSQGVDYRYPFIADRIDGGARRTL